MPQTTLLVFSHLRWNFVYQRPQHLMSRLASRRRIVFFEEPVVGEPDAPFIEYSMPAPNVLVCRPHTPSRMPGYHDEQLPYLTGLLKKMIRDIPLKEYILWFYTPMALPLAKVLTPRGMIYDCMDELSAFLNAPRQVVQRETALLKVADLVFTGGPSLHRAKKDRHPDVYCFPGSVDEKHFGRARSPIAEPESQKYIPRPRLGFFGVLDERIDLKLLDAMATAHPEWQLVMVGPVMKISQEDLPDRTNIHYLGQQQYADLPGFVAGWDLCLLPFALNGSTRFISPNQTLEYMAAEKPIVSTPITDVAEPYGSIVNLGESHEAFIAACEKALCCDRTEHEKRIAGMRGILSHTSWDATAKAMDVIITKSLGKKVRRERFKQQAAPGEGLASNITVPVLTSNQPGMPPHVVIGAGPTGLSAAYHLGADALLLEQHETMGGWCRSIQDRGFIFDHAGHIMLSDDPYVHRMYKLLLGRNVHWQEREAWVYSKRTYTRYPFHGALCGLPPGVIKECILGAIEAHFGSISNSRPHPAGEGLAHHVLPLAGRNREPRNLEEFIYKVWGTGIARHFAIPYNQKFWGLPLKEMEPSWLAGMDPLPDLDEIIDGALHPVPKPMGPHARFGYPLRGGFQALTDGFRTHLKGQFACKARVVAVSARQRTVTTEDGSRYRYQTLISTMPLPHLITMMGDEPPAEVRQAAIRLRHISVRNVNLGIARPDVTGKHWVYFPEDTVFHRIFVQGNASPHCNPVGGFGLTCETSYSPSKPLPCEGDDLIRRCIDDCTRIGLIKPGDRVIASNELDMPYAHVIFDHPRGANVAVVREWLEWQGIIPAGRYGEWEYYNSDHALIAGKKAAEKARIFSILKYGRHQAPAKPARRLMTVPPPA